jgi:hypothetical protein
VVCVSQSLEREPTPCLRGERVGAPFEEASSPPRCAGPLPGRARGVSWGRMWPDARSGAASLLPGPTIVLGAVVPRTPQRARASREGSSPRRPVPGGPLHELRPGA